MGFPFKRVGSSPNFAGKDGGVFDKFTQYNATLDETMTTAMVPVDPITATGGTKATPGDGYIYHLFTSNGNLSISSGDASMDCLIVGGGGGGGYDRGGGGGAGGFRPETLSAVPGTHPVTLGAGGAGDTAPGNPTTGGTGGDTTFTFNSEGYVANGGGGGSGDSNTSGGVDSPGNGSGGGTTGSPLGGTPWPGGDGGAYGNDGGGSSDGQGTGAGGGGAGGVGGNGNGPQPTTTICNVGGNGATLPWIPTAYGVSGYFAGGGGGGGRNYPYPNTPSQNPSAPGGGGRGGQDSPTHTATAATANTGSGGGGGDGSHSGAGASGAQGIVLIRYSA